VIRVYLYYKKKVLMKPKNKLFVIFISDMAVDWLLSAWNMFTV